LDAAKREAEGGVVKFPQFRAYVALVLAHRFYLKPVAAKIRKGKLR
jgi:hypothetical protein